MCEKSDRNVRYLQVKNLRKGGIYEKKCEEYEKFEKSAKIQIFEKSERIMRYVDKVIYAKKLQEVLELQQKFICVRKSEIFVQNVKKVICVRKCESSVRKSEKYKNN